MAQEINSIRLSVQDFYSRFGKDFSDTRHGYWSGFELVKDLVQPGDLVVDVGAGNGRLASVLPFTIRYLGIEPSESFRSGSRMDFATGSSPEIGSNPGRSLIEGALPELPVPDQTADVTTCIAVLHHLVPEELDDAITELIRITKPGGLIFATSWIFDADRLVQFERVADRSERERWVPWKANGKNEPRYVHVMDQEIWTRIWTRADLVIERIGYLGKEGWMDHPIGASNVAVIMRKN